MGAFHDVRAHVEPDGSGSGRAAPALAGPGLRSDLPLVPEDPGHLVPLRRHAGRRPPACRRRRGIAQSHIFEMWTRLTQIANLQPEIPLALREAAELVVNSGDSLGFENQQGLLRRLNARWDRRIVTAVREIVRSDRPPKERVIKHDRTREHGALANPGGRPNRINAA